jgi:predicted alpha/beta-fold hydrolase
LSRQGKEQGFSAALAARCLPLAEPYRAPRWLPGGHVQTIYAYVRARRGPVPLYSRRRWETPDGDFIDVDRIAGPADAPLVVLFHGLEGNSGSHYVRALSAHVVEAGWRLAIPHFRGCSGEPNRLARAYHSGDSAEIGWMLGQFAAEAQGTPLAAIGISLGGNALLKFLGEAGQQAQGMLRCAVAVSAPLDLMAAGEALGRGFNRVYARVFLATLKKKGAGKVARFPGLIDAEKVRRACTLREFDDAFTAPLHGFRNTDDYWRRSSSKPWLPYVRVPSLLLNARNDPFLPQAALPGVDEVSDCVELEFPEEGGHVGFTSGPFPGGFDWFGERIMSFIRRHVT